MASCTSSSGRRDISLRNCGMTISRTTVANTVIASEAMMTGATMRIREMPAAIKAVISLCR